jgi:hypothetical protein
LAVKLSQRAAGPLKISGDLAVGSASRGQTLARVCNIGLDHQVGKREIVDNAQETVMIWRPQATQSA